MGWVGCLFFKQKTAYEMRISDWSSDVCSSDLLVTDLELEIADDAGRRRRHFERRLVRFDHQQRRILVDRIAVLHEQFDHRHVVVVADIGHRDFLIGHGSVSAHEVQGDARRSEEHTSELQSLMRISYAVFCLKKKKIQIASQTYLPYQTTHTHG